MSDSPKIKIVINGNNSDRGYFSFINQAIRCLSVYYSDQIPIYIDFTQKNKFQKKYRDNIFEYIFEQPFISQSELKDCFICETDVMLSNTKFEGNIFKMTENDIALCRRVVKDFIKIKPEIKNEFDEIFKPFEGKKILGIHRRASDYTYHGKILEMDYVLNEVKRFSIGYDYIFLATEEQKTLSVFKENFKDKLIYLNAKRTLDAFPEFKKITDFDENNNLAKEVFFDAYFLSKCDLFLKTCSNVGNFSIVLNPDLKFIEIDKHIKYS